MKIVATTLCALGVGFGLGVVVHAQSPGTVAAEVAAAEAAAGDTWLLLQSEVCGPAQAAGTRFPLITQTRPAEKIFDNLYVLSNNDVLAWVITTSDGLVLVDTMYDRTVQEVIIDTMRKAGLDPAQIKYVYLTHKNSDHAGGAKLIQETYGARVLLSAVDWEGIVQPGRGGGAPSPVPPKKDMVIADGQKLTLGDETITFYVTPASTRGSVSALIPVKDKGVPHLVAFWASNVISPASSKEDLTAIAAAATRFGDIAAAAGADVLITNHERYFDLNKKLYSARANPAGRNPFIVGKAEVRNYMQVLKHCTQALALAAGSRK
jgi:metallo-beta-lactamase class B